MALRHQLAAYSPITASACGQGLAASLRLTHDERGRLLDLLRAEYAAEHGVLCGSGTQALQLAIRAAIAAIGAEVPVALPAFTCFDVASAAMGAGVKVMLYDVDPDTLGPDFESLERVVADGARVVVVGSLYGVPIAWDSVEDIARRFDALVIEDAAQGHGSTWRGRVVGSLGAISTLSFGRGKGWTGGSGGALLIRGGASSGAPLAVPDQLRSVGTGADMKTWLRLSAQWLLGRPSVYGVPRSVPALSLGKTTYKPPEAPISMARSAAAGVLANRLASLEEATRRRKNAEGFLGQLVEASMVRTIRVDPEGVSGYLRLPLRMTRGSAAVSSSGQLRRLGVESSYPLTLAELPAIRERLVPGKARWPGAERLRDELVTVPTHSLITRAERDQIVRALRGGGLPVGNE